MSEWKDIKENPPPFCKDVLFYHLIDEVNDVWHITQDSTTLFGTIPDDLGKVTHWMPLPDAPKPIKRYCSCESCSRFEEMENATAVECVFESDPESVAMWKRRKVFVFDCGQ